MLSHDMLYFPNDNRRQRRTPQISASFFQIPNHRTARNGASLENLSAKILVGAFKVRTHPGHGAVIFPSSTEVLTMSSM
jgi:hypothetical protein